MTETLDSWPAGSTWVFQGTIVSDATGGTHVTTLVVTPGAGNEMELMYGLLVVGNGAANISDIVIDDGTNIITNLITNQTSLGANARIAFPTTSASPVTGQVLNVVSPIIISGAMRLKMSVSTATVSLTTTYSVACRIKGAVPTATLADTVGTPALTVNTNKVF